MNYRNKIYEHYSTNRIGELVPASVEGFRTRAPFLNKIIREHFPEDKSASILEIGCGHGAFQYFISQFGYTNSIGIDGSKEQVKGAHSLGISKVIHGDLVSYLQDCEAGSIDVLVAFDVLEHFTKEELSDIVDHIYRILKVKGRLICHLPNGEGPFGNYMRHWDFTHELAFTRQSIAQLLLSSGFSSVCSYEDKPIPHGIKSTVRYVVWNYIIRSLYRFLVTVEQGTCDVAAIFSNNFLTVAIK